MITAAPTATRNRPDVNGQEPEARTLAGEHALLLREVRRQAGPVLALAAAGSWPDAELGALTGLLRSSVLRQVSDEEVLLYPDGTSVPFAELSAEHVRLYELTEQLDRADATSCTLSKLRWLVDELLGALNQHLIHEQAVLAALPDAPESVPAAADLVAGTQAWLPQPDGPVLILLDALPKERAVQMCVERLLRLRPGQSAEIHSSRDVDLQRVCRWMHDFDSTHYGIARPHTDLTQQTLRVTRRPVN